MAKRCKMTEKQATKAYFDKKITLAKYHEILTCVATKRHAVMIGKMKHRASMSSSKWTK